jgi:hypothetical protein
MVYLCLCKLLELEIFTQKDGNAQMNSESKHIPPAPPSGQVKPPVAYGQAIQTVLKAENSPPPTPIQLEAIQKTYTSDYVVKESEPAPVLLFTTLTKDGQEPFQRIVIRHKQAHDGYLYDWYVNPKSGVLISRDINKDLKVEKGVTLADIIYALVTKEVESILKVTSFPLSEIIQYNVASAATYPILQYIGLKDLPKTFRSDEIDTIRRAHFQALLGSVNLRSALYLVKNYGERLHISGIECIRIITFEHQTGMFTTGLSLKFRRT